MILTGRRIAISPWQGIDNQYSNQTGGLFPVTSPIQPDTGIAQNCDSEELVRICSSRLSFNCRDWRWSGLTIGNTFFHSMIVSQ
jgi:hypothetical protein